MEEVHPNGKTGIPWIFASGWLGWSSRKACLAGSRYVERVLPPAFKAGGIVVLNHHALGLAA
jgi:hypothetical protein